MLLAKVNDLGVLPLVTFIFHHACSIYFEKDQFFCRPKELALKENGGMAIAKGKKVATL